METTEKQRQASRENGALGGVKTLKGKTISSKNATKHAVLANWATQYDRLDIEQVYLDLATEFGDSSPSRKVLIEQLALIAIRLSRCARAETEILREALNPRVTETRDLLDFDFSQTVVIAEGEPATLTSDALEKFALIYERYEPKLVSRFLRIIGFLNQSRSE